MGIIGDSMKKAIEENYKTMRFPFPYPINDYVENVYLENHHCHKDFSNVSTPDSPSSIEHYVDRVKQFGTKCLYSMEHGNGGNFFYNYKVAEKENLKIIAGCEAYWVKDRHEKDKTNCHIIIHAKNDNGRKCINYMLSVANEDGFYYKPRVDLELIYQLPKDDVIVTSACIGGWKYEDADDIWLRMHDYFGGNFYFEVQPHDTEPQKRLNEKILGLSDRCGAEIICGLDSHYIEDTDSVRRDQILAYKKVHYDDEDGWYLDYPDTNTVVERFKKQGILSDGQIIRAIMNTNVFASDDVEPIILDRGFKIPTLYPGKTYDEKCRIYKRILNEAYRHEQSRSKEKADGIRYEAKQVIDSGVVDYFLTSKAIIDEAVNNQGGILTTTSRGSSASFITNKLLGITTVDRFNADVPIYPERFLTKERVLAGQMPDCDLNCAEQEPFVKAAKKLVGDNGVYPLMAVERLKTKAAWQMYASVSGISPSTANKVSRYIDDYENDLKHSSDDTGNVINIEDYIPSEYYDIFIRSREYQNIVINIKVHACGHIILNDDVRREIGLITAMSEATGKRTLCAAIEGSLLDEFGYVKEDFLIVDSVHLTYKFFKALGMKVPSFEELRAMVKDDKPTWDIYANGITCCINQCAKESTKLKAMKYKPQNIAELSSFIAGIRPGFSSLLNTFLNRQEYSTGEEKIDELLDDTAHFMIYQESIMKVLAFLELEMGETYGVIKSISKKKLVGEKKQHLLSDLTQNWRRKFGNIDNFKNIWNVIEDASRYAFNSPHAYSMAGDSLYQAWFKAHHTKLFYEVSIQHYQEKGNKGQIDDLIKEAVRHYSYKIGTYRFGDDNRRIFINEDDNTIMPNISSIKGIGEKVGVALYEIGKEQYQDFYGVLKKCYESQINRSVVDKLIKIDYFRDFGPINKLLNLAKYFEVFKYGEAKEISKEKAEKNGIPFDILQEYGKETGKQFGCLDSKKILNELLYLDYDKDIDLKTKLSYENDILGICKSLSTAEKNHHYFVQGIEAKKAYSNIKLYDINTGDILLCKIWNSRLTENQIEKNDLIYVSEIESKCKREWNGEVTEKTGKKVYVPVPGEYEYWIERYIRIDETAKDQHIF